MLETPRQLVARFERGEIDRTEFQTLMAIHARDLIEEIDEVHQNPFAAWLETKRAQSTVKKLLKQHSAFQIREILAALSEAPGFPMANYLWNAPHPDVPLHCFFRIGKEPVFRILSIKSSGKNVTVEMEILEPKNRQTVTLTRDQTWQLRASSISTSADQE
ncbi:hypothetical protein [Luteolibacter sp. AS25]|uniref:hypothetical protein n=1 Tax=Luteolibacter sp. AS25 TaxID=3135776 RepID=UPI00398A71AF